VDVLLQLLESGHGLHAEERLVRLLEDVQQDQQAAEDDGHNELEVGLVLLGIQGVLGDGAQDRGLVLTVSVAGLLVVLEFLVALRLTILPRQQEGRSLPLGLLGIAQSLVLLGAIVERFETPFLVVPQRVPELVSHVRLYFAGESGHLVERGVYSQVSPKRVDVRRANEEGLLVDPRLLDGVLALDAGGLQDAFVVGVDDGLVDIAGLDAVQILVDLGHQNDFVADGCDLGACRGVARRDVFLLLIDRKRVVIHIHITLHIHRSVSLIRHARSLVGYFLQ